MSSETLTTDSLASQRLGGFSRGAAMLIGTNGFFDSGLASSCDSDGLLTNVDSMMSLIKKKEEIRKQEKTNASEAGCPLKATLLWRHEGLGNGPGQFYWPVHATFVQLPSLGVIMAGTESKLTGSGSYTNSLRNTKLDLLAVCDRKHLRIQLLELTKGTCVAIFAKGLHPRRIVQDSYGRLHISDGISGGVKVFSPYLQYLGRWRDNLFQEPIGMIALADGRTIMSDAERCFVSFHSSWEPSVPSNCGAADNGPPAAVHKAANTCYASTNEIGKGAGIVSRFTARTLLDPQ